MTISQHRIDIKPNLKNPPDKFERAAAEILLDYFDSNIKFIPSNSGHCSPDLFVTRLRQRWEIKTPRGNSKNTIHHQLEGIDRQSENVIISLLRTKMTPKTAIGRLKSELSRPNRIRRLILVTKQGKVLEIKPGLC